MNGKRRKDNTREIRIKEEQEKKARD